MIIVIIFFWLLFTLFVAVYAGNKKTSASGAFGSFITALFISIIFSPLIGFVAVLLTKPNQKAIEENLLQSGEMKKCLQCAELVKREAVKCRFCGYDFSSNIKDTSFKSIPIKEVRSFWWDMCLGLAIVFLLAIIFILVRGGSILSFDSVFFLLIAIILLPFTNNFTKKHWSISLPDRTRFFVAIAVLILVSVLSILV